MPLGGEKKSFSMQTFNTDFTFDTLFNAAMLQKKYIQSDKDWVWLASDAFVDEKILEKSYFTLAQHLGFRNIISPDAQRYQVELSQQGKNGNKRYKSEYFSLLKRGSLIFPQEDIKPLLDDTQFQNIGYNTYFKK